MAGLNNLMNNYVEQRPGREGNSSPDSTEIPRILSTQIFALIKHFE
jgi:hypothetical protein